MDIVLIVAPDPVRKQDQTRGRYAGFNLAYDRGTVDAILINVAARGLELTTSIKLSAS